MPIWTTVAYPPRNAKDEPRNAGTFIFVQRWKMRVPRPAKSRVALIERPVITGTRTVAPNMANMCWRPSVSILPVPSDLASKTAVWVCFVICLY